LKARRTDLPATAERFINPNQARNDGALDIGKFILFPRQIPLQYEDAGEVRLAFLEVEQFKLERALCCCGTAG
jgi:hypothetical protein